MIDATGSATAATQQQQTAPAQKNALGEQDFLQLLVTQLKQQDPLNPMDNTEYISQLAQFSSLEQMTNMSSQLGTLNSGISSLEGMDAANLVGKQVAYSTTDSSGKASYASGTVSGVSLQNGTPELIVGSATVPIGSVVEVAGAPAAQ